MTKAARLRARSSPRPTRQRERAAWVVVAHAAPSPSIRDFQHDLAAFVGGTSEHLVCHLCLIKRQNRADPCFQRAAFEQVGDLRQPLGRHIDKHEYSPNPVLPGLLLGWL